MDGMGLEKEQMLQIQTPVTGGGEASRMRGVEERGLGREELSGEGRELSAAEREGRR